MATILQTDYAWPDDGIERAILEAAGHRLVCGPAEPADAAAIEGLIAAHDPVAILTNWAQVNARAIARPTDLRIVQRLGVGLDNIAVEAASARGAWVANVPDYCVGEVADHAIAMLLAWARGLIGFDRAVKDGRWTPAQARLRRVADLTVGVVGYGRIGRNTAGKLRALGCRVLAHTRTPPTTGTDDQEFVALTHLLEHSDAVILHLPLTVDNPHMIGSRELAAMKPGAFLINVSRGGLIDTAALIAALDRGHLSGAGLDVVEGEPSPPRELAERTEVIMTPHVAFSSEASITELRRRAAQNVVRVLAGDAPLHICNQPMRPQ